MKKYFYLCFLLFIVMIIGFPVSGFCVSDQDDNMNMAIKGSNEFSLDFYRQLSGSEGNLFFSPYSIAVALAMTYAGARGRTAEQMKQVLRNNLGQGEISSIFGKMNNDLASRTVKADCQLDIANALWAQEGFNFLEEYLQLLKNDYNAGVFTADFIQAAEEARQKINSWVDGKTAGKIKNLIPEGILSDMTRLVLVNAVYFQGRWASQFEKGNTREMDFHLNAEKKAATAMMCQKGEFAWLAEDNIEITVIPYTGTDLAMVVLLPREIDGLPRLEKDITIDKLEKWLSQTHRQELELYIPKFNVTCGLDLNNILRAMGMTDAFDNKIADFSGMNGHKDLFISQAMHQAYIKVDEKGTEATAATAVVMNLRCALPKTKIFRADHPFMFIIRSDKTGNILFMGRMTRPEE